MNQHFLNNNCTVHWKMSWITITKTMVINFMLQNSHLLHLSSPTEEVFSGKQPKLASGKSSSCWFSFSAERNANIKATEYVTFSFSFSILVSFSFLKVWTSVCQRYGFFNILAAVIQESSDKRLVWRIVKALPFIHWPDQVAPKASDVSTADWLY